VRNERLPSAPGWQGESEWWWYVHGGGGIAVEVVVVVASVVGQEKTRKGGPTKPRGARACLL